MKHGIIVKAAAALAALVLCAAPALAADSYIYRFKTSGASSGPGPVPGGNPGNPNPGPSNPEPAGCLGATANPSSATWSSVESTGSGCRFTAPAVALRYTTAATAAVDPGPVAATSFCHQVLGPSYGRTAASGTAGRGAVKSGDWFLASFDGGRANTITCEPTACPNGQNDDGTCYVVPKDGDVDCAALAHKGGPENFDWDRMEDLGETCYFAWPKAGADPDANKRNISAEISALSAFCTQQLGPEFKAVGSHEEYYSSQRQYWNGTSWALTANSNAKGGGVTCGRTPCPFGEERGGNGVCYVPPPFNCSAAVRDGEHGWDGLSTTETGCGVNYPKVPKNGLQDAEWANMHFDPITANAWCNATFGAGMGSIGHYDAYSRRRRSIWNGSDFVVSSDNTPAVEYVMCAPTTCPNGSTNGVCNVAPKRLCGLIQADADHNWSEIYQQGENCAFSYPTVPSVSSDAESRNLQTGIDNMNTFCRQTVGEGAGHVDSALEYYRRNRAIWNGSGWQVSSDNTEAANTVVCGDTSCPNGKERGASAACHVKPALTCGLVTRGADRDFNTLSPTPTGGCSFYGPQVPAVSTYGGLTPYNATGESFCQAAFADQGGARLGSFTVGGGTDSRPMWSQLSSSWVISSTRHASISDLVCERLSTCPDGTIRKGAECVAQPRIDCGAIRADNDHAFYAVYDQPDGSCQIYGPSQPRWGSTAILPNDPTTLEAYCRTATDGKYGYLRSDEGGFGDRFSFSGVAGYSRSADSVYCSGTVAAGSHGYAFSPAGTN